METAKSTSEDLEAFPMQLVDLKDKKQKLMGSKPNTSNIIGLGI